MDVFHNLFPRPGIAYMRTFLKLTCCSTFSSIKDPKNEYNYPLYTRILNVPKNYTKTSLAVTILV